MHDDVRQLIDGYDEPARQQLLAVRDLVFSEAARHAEIGELVETLKWGQLSYLPLKSRVGTTVRFDAVPGCPSKLAMYLNCQTTLVDGIRQLYPATFEFKGNREIVFDADAAMPETELRHCIALALTYHLKKTA